MEVRNLHKKYNFLTYLIKELIIAGTNDFDITDKICATDFVQKKEGEYTDGTIIPGEGMKAPKPNDILIDREKKQLLSEIIEEIAPDVKKVAKDRFGRDIVLLWGEYYYMPIDVKKIAAINGAEASMFIEYCEELSELSQKINNELIGDLEMETAEDYEKIVLQFLENLKQDFNS